MYAIFIFIAISSRSRSSWSFCLLKKRLAIKECATEFCLTRRVVTALNGHLLEPWSSVVSFLKLFEPERNCYFPATQGTWRQILQIMQFFSSKKKHQPREFLFPLGMEFSFLGHIWCWCFRFFWSLLQSSSAAISMVLFWTGVLGDVWWVVNVKSVRCDFGFTVFGFFDVLSCFSVPLSFAFHLFMMGTKWLVSKQVPGRLSKAPALNPRVLTLSGGISDSVDSPTDINIEVNRKVVFILRELVLRYPRKMTLPQQHM